MKLESVKLANSIAIGGREETFLQTKNFELNLVEPATIIVKHRMKGEEVCTSLFNCISYKRLIEEEPKPDAEALTPRAPARAARRSS